MRNEQQHAGKVAFRTTTALMVYVAFLAFPSCLTTSKKWEPDRTIAFSPDDSAIAYQHRGSVFVARTREDDHRRLFTAGGKSQVSSPQWASDHQGLVFAESDGTPDAATGLLRYSVWFWRAPKELWRSSRRKAEGDSVSLPSKWAPGSPTRVWSGRCRAIVQISGNALIQWLPDGKRLICLDTDDAGRQTPVVVDVGTRHKTPASPVHAVSLAVNVSPDGRWLQCVAADSDSSQNGLWIGPLAPDSSKWERLEPNPGPESVPAHRLPRRTGLDESFYLHDLRPRLGCWSPDSERLAYVRRVPGEPPEHVLVVRPVVGDGKSQFLTLSGGVPADLRWDARGVRLGLLVDRQLMLLDAESDRPTRLAGATRVERFAGWSAPGEQIAYLTPQTAIPTAEIMLPTGDRIVWGPVDRHHLMVAQADGTAPESRFSGMNVTFLQWANEKPKLSFWATYLPSVSNLPPGDPAAVLDVESNAISWYPTDLAEYAQVGHYYLLNHQYGSALDRYTEALQKVGDSSDSIPLRTQIRLWSAICRLRLGREGEARDDLRFFREHVSSLLPRAEPSQPPAPAIAESLAEALAADRLLFSTMLSMDQVALAVEQAQRVAADGSDARSLQAQCFLALVDQATSDGNRLARRITHSILPAALKCEDLPAAQIQDFIDSMLAALLSMDALAHVDADTKQVCAEKLSALSSAEAGNPQTVSRSLALAAAALYRDLGDQQRELLLLKRVVNMQRDTRAEPASRI